MSPDTKPAKNSNMTQLNTPKKAVILVSGGLDSSTVLALATAQGYECYTISFDYGQRHRAELQAATHISKYFNVKDHRIANVDLSAFGGSALTDTSIDVPEQSPQEGIPITYVPARNTVFLSYALAWAEVLDAHHIMIGVNAVDYSGYPDCRPEYIEAYEKMANLATRMGVEDSAIVIDTPLMTMTKGEIIKLGLQNGVDYALTVSCYQADSEGKACGKCESCQLRAQGFKDAGISDPTQYQAAI